MKGSQDSKLGLVNSLGKINKQRANPLIQRDAKRVSVFDTAVCQTLWFGALPWLVVTVNPA